MKGEWGTLLEHALYLGKEEAAVALISRGAKIPEVTLGREPTINAAARLGEKLLTLVHRSGANVNAVCPKGLTPLMNAAQRAQIGCARYLIANGADVNAVDNKGYTALSFAKHRESLVLEELLISVGADPTCKTFSGTS